MATPWDEPRRPQSHVTRVCLRTLPTWSRRKIQLPMKVGTKAQCSDVSMLLMTLVRASRSWA